MGKTILVVDDEQHVVQVVRAMLTREGHEVIVASNGQEALRTIENCRPDLILLDIVMPEMDGATLAEELHKRQETAKIPIVFLTGLVDSDRGRDGSALAGQHVLPKPFGAEELYSIIELATGGDSPNG